MYGVWHTATSNCMSKTILWKAKTTVSRAPVCCLKNVTKTQVAFTHPHTNTFGLDKPLYMAFQPVLLAVRDPEKLKSSSHFLFQNTSSDVRLANMRFVLPSTNRSRVGNDGNKWSRSNSSGRSVSLTWDVIVVVGVKRSVCDLNHGCGCYPRNKHTITGCDY